MKRAVAASCCLLLCGRAWSFSVTMPTDTPVTLDFDDLERRERRPDPPAREREPREYREPSASSADPAEALAALAAILAAPVVIVGGAIYLAGKRFTDWLEETRRAREDARLREEERRRLMEEERRRLEAVTAELDARSEAGRERAYASLEVLLDALASEADAGEFEFSYEGLALETERVVKLRSGKNKFARGHVARPIVPNDPPSRHPGALQRSHRVGKLVQSAESRRMRLWSQTLPRREERIPDGRRVAFDDSQQCDGSQRSRAARHEDRRRAA